MSTEYQEEEFHEFSLKKKDETVHYRLRNITGEQRDLYTKEIRKRMGRNMQGVMEVKDQDGLMAIIFEYACERNVGSEDIPEWVSIKGKESQSWPSKMQLELNEIALKLSGLDSKAREEAKND